MPPETFGLADVREQARELAARPYSAPPDQTLPPDVAQIPQEQFEQAHYDRRRALWRDSQSPFQVQLYLRSPNHPKRVWIYQIEEGKVVPVTFSRDLFVFAGASELERAVSPDFGFAGARLLYPVNEPTKYDEVFSQLGGTYFRALGRGQDYGSSARGLAIDTGMSRPEEFPFFEKLWLVRPAPGARSATLFALMTSPSATGAYELRVTPGETTVVEVRAVLFFRQGVERLGIAPVTSMFLRGVGQQVPAAEGAGRGPAVHDSDGLLLADGTGEWIWRPLRNPPHEALSDFHLTSPRGFGLMQRRRDPAQYADESMHYAARPSVWVEPLESWGSSAVQLLELPSDTANYDNIDAYWLPARPVSAGEELHLHYRVEFSLSGPASHTGGKVVSTHVSPSPDDPADAQFLVTFSGPQLDALPPAAPVRAVVTASDPRAAIGTVRAIRLGDGGGWQASFFVTLAPSPPAGTAPLELRAFLRSGTNVLTETWSYPWPP